MRTITATVLLFLIKLSSQENYCEPRASGYIGQSATISCNLDTTGSRSIFWYYENYDNDPLIRLEGGEKRGQGYDRNEYDLLQNGSLVITNVTSSNEGSYKVILGVHDPVEFRTAITFSVIENYCLPQASGYLGKVGIISCHFKTGFKNLYWFNESDHDEPFIRFETGNTLGSGHRSGEYDILRNGSLLIKNVTTSNEQSYKVILPESNFDQVIDFAVIETNCNVLFLPENGNVSQNGTFATFSCNDGFHVNGSYFLKCTYDSESRKYQWSGTSPVCIQDNVTPSGYTFSYEATNHSDDKGTSSSALSTETIDQSNDNMPERSPCIAAVVVAVAAVAVVVLLVYYRRKKAQKRKYIKAETENNTIIQQNNIDTARGPHIDMVDVSA